MVVGWTAGAIPGLAVWQAVNYLLPLVVVVELAALGAVAATRGTSMLGSLALSFLAAVAAYALVVAIVIG